MWYGHDNVLVVPSVLSVIDLGLDVYEDRFEGNVVFRTL